MVRVDRQERVRGRTWVVGDIHGCAEALARLLGELDLRKKDRLLSAGDLFHRGPEPFGVYEQLEALGPRFGMVMGNHEWALLNRIDAADGSLDDLRGDNGAAMASLDDKEAMRIVRFLRDRPYAIEGERPDGQGWYLVHASVLPGKHPGEMTPRQLVRLSRCTGVAGEPTWLSRWRGPELVAFGHAQSMAGRHRRGGKVVAWGLDTGAVYGRELTALCLEELVTVAVQAYV
jgi:serine/threonine protein phosphatase 1